MQKIPCPFLNKNAITSQADCCIFGWLPIWMWRSISPKQLDQLSDSSTRWCFLFIMTKRGTHLDINFLRDKVCAKWSGFDLLIPSRRQLSTAISLYGFPERFCEVFWWFLLCHHLFWATGAFDIIGFLQPLLKLSNDRIVVIFSEV